ncbi:arsenite S-adenosylmethyltransferase [Limnochorda pilosa]|uniref:Arsenite S-adenosylmethyltransferase n=2 Tax=Limnochorda pilosa TaxID=1555112 RepID=A0A0K2SH08_LIMPI|nr:arsenite S-adenosylmethyltransferase [Limnochorda pilosa]
MRLDRRRLETVRHYDRSAARAASRGRGRELQDQERSTQEIPMASGGCCSSSGCGCGGAPDEIPSWGCTLDPLFGDPAPGEVVLDLGCGTGRNAFEAARRVGPTGRVYGLDLSPTMLAEARRHRDRLGLSHVSFLQAPMEAVPLPDGSVDLVISDCVLNLSTDKPRVLREAFRVLRPGGRLAIADVVRTVPDPAEPESSEGWSACVDGAITADAYLALLAQAGFTEPSVEVLHGGGAGEAAPRVATAHVRARRA